VGLIYGSAELENASVVREMVREREREREKVRANGGSAARSYYMKGQAEQPE
jgi:hypothetical protein